MRHPLGRVSLGPVVRADQIGVSVWANPRRRDWRKSNPAVFGKAGDYAKFFEGASSFQGLVTWESIVAASLTSNLPGPSTFSVWTTPSLTSIE